MKALSLSLLICCCAALRAHHVAAIRVSRDFPFKSRLRGGGGGRGGGGEGRGKGTQGGKHCSLVSREYRSSKLEQTWLDNANSWSEDFCSHMEAFSKETQHWLDVIATLERGNGSSSAAAAMGENDVFSSFVSTYDCSGETVEKVTWIEPLSHGLRHPRALCGGGASLFDRGYLLLASRDDYAKSPPARKRNKSVHDYQVLLRADTAAKSARGDDDADGDASDADDVLSRETTGSSRSNGFSKESTASSQEGVLNRRETTATTRSSVLSESVTAADRTKNHTTRTKNLDCAEPLHQNIFVDLGASTWDAGIGGPSQSWFYDSYKQRGIEFDRLLMWEAKETPVSEIFSSLPKDLWHKYQYFNWPASSNASDQSSPLNIIKKIAQPGDFVVLKLDIDTPSVELPIVRELLNDPKLLELLDEFFFEYHVSFAPMNPSWFGSENPTITKDTLADSYRVFRILREKGVRAHSWV